MWRDEVKPALYIGQELENTLRRDGREGFDCEKPILTLGVLIRFCYNRKQNGSKMYVKL